MQLTKLDDKGILLTPHTAMEQNFIDYLVRLIEVKEAKFLSDHALELQSLAQDSPPLTEESQSS